MMKTDIYLKLQKKFGGKWVATSKRGDMVYAQGKNVASLFANLQKKHLSPQKTVIGFIERYGQVSAYLSLSGCLRLTRRNDAQNWHSGVFHPDVLRPYQRNAAPFGKA